MTNRLADAGRQQAYRLVARQALVVFVAVIVIAAGWGWQAGYSALLGALIAVLPNLLFARIAFQQAGARAARQVVHGFYKGEAAKIGLTILLFVIVLSWVPIRVGTLFAAYGIGVLAQWLAPVLLQRK
ncbi:ATP synthase subunit I [Gallaecimonas xiamenensis]|uniref:ATP synthase subunit I n=1 Tax=Gallaecimonas xiamenensis TaxID=1207039 RepID=UPI001ED99DD7|nr:ATP synthase subunit I [Gallaecimonas xiamenensis]